MKSWIKWVLVGALIALPAAGFAITKYHARAHCPATPGCPCAKNKI